MSSLFTINQHNEEITGGKDSRQENKGDREKTLRVRSGGNIQIRGAAKGAVLKGPFKQDFDMEPGK